MKTFLKNRLYFLGKEAKMNLFGRRCYKTALGAFLGLINITAVFILSIFLFMDLFNRQNISLIYNKSSKPNMTINMTKRPMSILVRCFRESAE